MRSIFNLLLPFVSLLIQAQSTDIQLADSEMTRFQEAWQLDYGKKPYFVHSQGLGCLGILKTWKQTNHKKYMNHVIQWADSIMNNIGEIYLYKVETYNIDYLNSAKIPFVVYKKNGNEKYMVALDRLVKQLKMHPQTLEGAFWHKLIYPHQAWLDGLYTSAPFLTQKNAAFQCLFRYIKTGCVRSLLSNFKHMKLAWPEQLIGHISCPALAGVYD